MTTTPSDSSLYCRALHDRWTALGLMPIQVANRLRTDQSTVERIAKHEYPLSLERACEMGLRLGLFPGALMRAARGGPLPGRDGWTPPREA